jgi:hypothetical protein
VNGVTKYATVFKDMPVLHFKLLVCTMFGIVVDEMRLAFQGRDLEDDKTMGDYGLVELSNVEVLGRLRGGMPPRKSVPAVRYVKCEDFVQVHFSGFMHLTNPILDTLNNALGISFDIRKGMKHELVTQLLTRIYDLLYNPEVPDRLGVDRDLAQYEAWVNGLSKRHQDYIDFLRDGLGPPITARTLIKVAAVLNVPSVIHDDDKIMETAKALAFHHFLLMGEIPPAPTPAADTSVTFHQVLPQRADGEGGEGDYEYVVTVRRDEDVEAVLGRRMDSTEWDRFKRCLRYSLDYCVPDEINRVLVDNFGKDSEAATSASASASASPSPVPVQVVKKNKPKAPPKKKAVTSEEDIVYAETDLQPAAPWPTFGAAPGGAVVDFAAACGVSPPAGRQGGTDDPELSVFMRPDPTTDTFVFHDETTRADVEGWVNKELDDEEWETVKGELETALYGAIDGVFQDIFNIVSRATSAKESESFKERPVVVIDSYKTPPLPAAPLTPTPTPTPAADASVTFHQALPQRAEGEGEGGVRFQIFVVDYADKTHTFDINGFTTVGDLRAMVYEAAGIQPDRIRFIFSGKQWNDDRVTVKSIFGDLYKDRTVNLMDRMKGGMPAKGGRGGAQKRKIGGIALVTEPRQFEVMTVMKDQLLAKVTSIGNVDISYLNQVGTTVNNFINEGEANQQSALMRKVRGLSVDDIKKLIAIINGSQNVPFRFQQMSQVIFKREINMMVSTKMKFATIQSILQNAVEYVFALQYTDDSGSYMWKQCVSEIDELKEAMIDSRAEARGRASAAASAAGSPQGPMQLD